ncbi:D-3-phosphoglycerate dehydrogenase [Spirosomataceae bacterium TFI 002]|nr:D-3-phosphoglycerate dehydrogenase [Spirosomataceae bacterium TFI 002]
MKILIVDEMHESIVRMPEELGLDVDYFPKISFQEVLEKVGEYEGLIIRSKFNIDANFLSHAPKLKFIGRAGAGLDLIDTKACERHNIAVFGANEANKVAVSEHLIGMILSLLHRIVKADSEVRKGQWFREENRAEELFGKKVGLIGYGNNGQATAERLAAFGCQIYAYDKYKYGFGNHLVTECTLETIFEEAEIVSLHIPLTDETVNWFNEDLIQKFKKDFFFCNIARGEIANLSDVVNGLKSGKIRGACLDVIENEKLGTLSPSQKITFDDLVSFPNVIITPHVAGWSNESYVKINNVLRDKIKRFLGHI